MNQNLSMVDFAILDPRSISAMLRNIGDGREQVWLKFERKYPEIPDQEILMEFFSREARYGRVGGKKLNIGWLILTLFLVSI
jgi:hypothetical protein